MTTRGSVAAFEALLTQLEPLREQMRRRRPPLTEEEITAKLVAIARMQFRIVGLCAGCNEPICAGDPRILVDGRLAHRTCTGREPERELYGAELQEAKDREVRKVQAMREEAAARRGRRKGR